MNKEKKKKMVKLIASLASIGLFLTMTQLTMLSEKELQTINNFVIQVQTHNGNRNCGIPSIA